MPRVPITDSWVAGNEAVARWSVFCAKQRWPFLENDGRTDFGKDGYVDLSTADGRLLGQCFAVQIKGGVSRWGTNGYRIEADEAKRSRWARSTLPVFAVAFDPSDESFCWMDLTAELRDKGLDTSLVVPRRNHLTDERGVDAFVKYAEAVSQPASYLLDLGATDRDLQLAAVSLSYFIGRADGRALVLLRRTLFSLCADAFRYGTFQLAKAMHHPDFFARNYTWVEEPARAQLRASLDWTPSEVVRLVGLIEDDGIQRGSFGQHIFHLLVDAPDGRSCVERGLAHAIELRDDFAITHLLNIAVSLAGDQGTEHLRGLVDRYPSIKSHDHVAELFEYLDQFRWLHLF